MKFCQREVKRGNKYDAVILDPPSYGHGPKGEVWKIGEQLLPLLELCGELTAESRAFVLVTCHSPGIGPAELSAYLSEGIFGHCGQPPKAGELFFGDVGRPATAEWRVCALAGVGWVESCETHQLKLLETWWVSRSSTHPTVHCGGNFGIRLTIGAPPLRSSSSISRTWSGSVGSSSTSVLITSSAICGLPIFSSAQTSPRPASKKD